MTCDHCGPTNDPTMFCACGCGGDESWCGCDECLKHHWRSSSEMSRIRELQDFGKSSGREHLELRSPEFLPPSARDSSSPSGLSGPDLTGLNQITPPGVDGGGRV